MVVWTAVAIWRQQVAEAHSHGTSALPDQAGPLFGRRCAKLDWEWDWCPHSPTQSQNLQQAGLAGYTSNYIDKVCTRRKGRTSWEQVEVSVFRSDCPSETSRG